MSASSETSAHHSSTNPAILPSNQDSRFALNTTIQLVQQGEVHGYGFSYPGADKRQVTEWVFSASYVPPPATEATMESVPTGSNRSFDSLEEWTTALKATGPDAIWQPGSTFARSFVATFQGVPSDDPQFYKRFEQWPTVAPAPGDSFGQVDPGPSHAPARWPEEVDAANTVDAKAAIQVVSAVGEGHTERSSTNVHTVEFWALFSGYSNPTSASLPLVPGPPKGVPVNQSLPDFLKFWHDPSAPEAAKHLAVVTCVRSRNNPYGG